VPLLKALFSKASAKVIHFSETTKLLWIFFDKNFHFIHHGWLMKALFLQPTTYQTDDFLSCRLWERQDASFVRTAMTHINMQVLLVLGERQAINARSSPRIDIAININHLRIILGQELYRMIIECW